MTENVDKGTIEVVLKWIGEHPYVALPLIFYGVTAYLSAKRDKSFWQVWFNGRTPLWLMGSKHKKRAIDKKNIENNKDLKEDQK
jgi:hypothetical protein